MKNFFLNRIFLIIFAFAAGATSVWAAKYFENKEKQVVGLSKSLLIENNYEKILDSFFKESLGFQGSFDTWFKNNFGFEIASNKKLFFNQSFIQETKQWDDGEFKIFEIDLDGQTPKEVKVDVKDKQVIISAQIERKKETDHSSQFYSSSFHRSFPVPSGVDENNFKMEKENQKIVIKFPKKKV